MMPEQPIGRLDNELGDGVPADPQPDLCARVRHWLGLDHIHEHLRRQEIEMATITEALTALAEQVNAVSAVQASSFHNLQVAIDTLKSGELSQEQQAAVDQIEKSLTQLSDDAQKADDGFEPAQPPADNGGDTPPADNGGDTPVVDGGDPADVPVADKTKR